MMAQYVPEQTYPGTVFALNRKNRPWDRTGLSWDKTDVLQYGSSSHPLYDSPFPTQTRPKFETLELECNVPQVSEQDIFVSRGLMGKI